MYTVTRIIRFCYGHRLMNYEGQCRHLHGHNGKVEIELASEQLDQRGMVRDFEEIKRSVQRWIDSTLDHTMLLRKDDPLLPVLLKRGERFLALEGNPTAEAIAKLIFEYTAAQGFPVTEVRLWETDQSVASYREARVATRPSVWPHSFRAAVFTAASSDARLGEPCGRGPTTTPPASTRAVSFWTIGKVMRSRVSGSTRAE